jgi:hypothetical protein
MGSAAKGPESWAVGARARRLLRNPRTSVIPLNSAAAIRI